jgi:hypothetical protein
MGFCPINKIHMEIGSAGDHDHPIATDCTQIMHGPNHSWPWGHSTLS